MENIVVKNPLSALPNLITGLRFILTGLFIWTLAGWLFQKPLVSEAASISSGNLPVNLYIVFAFICLSDFLDGAAARRLKAETALGGILDILADCLFIFSSLVILNISGLLPVWFTIFVLVDFVVFLATSRFLAGRKTFVFDMTGRIAAVLFYFVPAAACVVYSHPVYNNLLNALLYFAVFLAAISMVGRCISCYTTWQHI